jgi:hypothetical protein
MTRASHSVEPAFGPFPADMTITSVVSDRGGNYKNAASELGGGDNAHTW